MGICRSWESVIPKFQNRPERPEAVSFTNELCLIASGDTVNSAVGCGVCLGGVTEFLAVVFLDFQEHLEDGNKNLRGGSCFMGVSIENPP